MLWDCRLSSENVSAADLSGNAELTSCIHVGGTSLTLHVIQITSTVREITVVYVSPIDCLPYSFQLNLLRNVINSVVKVNL